MIPFFTTAISKTKGIVSISRSKLFRAILPELVFDLFFIETLWGHLCLLGLTFRSAKHAELLEMV